MLLTIGIYRYISLQGMSITIGRINKKKAATSGSCFLFVVAEATKRIIGWEEKVKSLEPLVFKVFQGVVNYIDTILILIPVILLKLHCAYSDKDDRICSALFQLSHAPNVLI